MYYNIVLNTTFPSSLQEKAREKQLAANPLTNGVEHAGVHIALKKLLKLDQEKRQEDAASSQFGSAVLENLPDEAVRFRILHPYVCLFSLKLIYYRLSLGSRRTDLASCCC